MTLAELSLSDLADLVTIIGVAAAIVSAVVAYRGWRHRTGHWLYIPAPDVLSQDPAKPTFWVFPPYEVEKDVFAVVIAGTVVNAGPSDAFSVRIYVEPELEWERGIDVLRAAAAIAAGHERTEEDTASIMRGFLDVYKNRRSLIPVLRVGQEQRFVVIAELKRGDQYLEDLLKSDGGSNMSAHWETRDRRQAHGVHAVSRTILGRQIVFGPDDLCAPFEVGGFSLGLAGRFGRLKPGTPTPRPGSPSWRRPGAVPGR